MNVLFLAATLVTPFYTNVVTVQHDTVFVLDAQTSADRAQQDSVWIGKLFPGNIQSCSS